ncbi:MipA/OmpV family protein [Sulfitobacter guttiformis]|uniref:MltA-interacting MipA family protein n=1 Tax=Sulfitobacter guttiformis TaxID=74349 RepID=J7G2E7_9RHOB|nr:MipA/OmpV family protein [Sulfitobacter guttiformis]AFP55429.1 MltA-interacting MipA family protein [Sulfitobacter guttiformis]KIN75444.1 MltA-interacting MipA family protein [Sulfitobacter guttiformis KCTC 32187]RKE92051.1 outer membrane scaffolding protein for murein synthesis (MipA/OmpV family) [Sulfitobacter guttiformis]
MRVISAAIVTSVALAAPAVAQERSFNFSLGTSVGAAPEYMGSDSYGGVVTPSFKFGSLKWGSVDTGNGVRGIPANGLSVKGAFKILGERTVEDSPELAGLEDIDLAVELGFGLTYQQTNWMAFGEVRKGVTGHSGVTGTLGADWIMRPNDRWLFTAGPRVNFGNDEYANTYFGVSGATNFADYTASGGALSAGIAMSGTYFIDDKWALEGTVSYEKLMNDAADSPLTLNGSEDQWRIGLGVSRVFTLNF